MAAQQESLPVVVVTGATGFVGSAVIAQLLMSGRYRVRGTVRDPSKTARLAFLHALPTAPGIKLELGSGDLTSEGSFDDTMSDATYVIHTAASVTLTSRDPQREIIDANVNGALNVLRSCAKAAKAGQLKKVVMTSSVAAVQEMDLPADHVYTEADYNLSANVNNDPYPASKYLSEKAAQDFVNELAADSKFELAFINPGAIYGPALAPHHNEGSVVIVHDLMIGKFPMAPKLAFPAVDVRDVARAHILAMEKPGVQGRFLCVVDTAWMREISLICKEKYPQYVWPTRQLPNALMYLTALFDARVSISFCRRHLSKRPVFSNEKIKKELGLEFIPLKESLYATVESLLDLGIVPRKPAQES